MGWRWGRRCLVEKWGAGELELQKWGNMFVQDGPGGGRQNLTGNRKSSTRTECPPTTVGFCQDNLSQRPVSADRRALQLGILALRVYTLLIETDRVKMLKHDTFARQPTGAFLRVLSLRHWLPLDRLGLCPRRLLHSDRFNFRYRAVFRASISNSGTLPSLRPMCIYAPTYLATSL